MQQLHPVKVLIIEDESKIARWLATFLKQANFTVFSAQDGATGLLLARNEHPEVVILDLMLPDMDGLDVCRELRKRTDTFIIMLTARVEEADRLIGLEVGADAYMTKPFSPREVIAQIRAFLRRSSGALTVQPPILKHNALTLDPTRRLCSLNGQPVALTPTEFAILETLMRHPGLPFTRERLIDEALGTDYSSYDRTIDAHVRNLRRKIELDPQNPVYIVTVFNVGYRFAEAEQAT